MTDEERRRLREKLKQKSMDRNTSPSLYSSSEKPELQKWLPFIMGFGGCLFCVLLVVAGIGIGKRLNKPDSENKKVAEATLDEFETESTTEETTEAITEATTEAVTEATTEATTEVKEPKKEYIEENYEGLKFKYPSDWNTADVDGSKGYSPENNSNNLMTITVSEDTIDKNFEELKDDELNYIALQYAMANIQGSEKLIDYGVKDFKGNISLWYTAEEIMNNNDYLTNGQMIYHSGKFYNVIIASKKNISNPYEKEFEKIVDSMTFEDDDSEAKIETKKKSSSEKKTADVKKSEKKSTKDTMTAGQRNAVQKMKDYLEYTSFSEQGMRKQLAYEGFSDADIDYAIEHNPVDWYEQAIKKAKDYLKYSSFSKEKLIKQLEYEGYTSDQAQVGADAAYQ